MREQNPLINMAHIQFAAANMPSERRRKGRMEKNRMQIDAGYGLSYHTGTPDALYQRRLTE